SQSAWLTTLASGFRNASETPRQLGNAHPNIVPYQVFKTSDKYIILAVGTERQWNAFCEALGLAELKKDSRFITNVDRTRNRSQLVPILDELFGTECADHWLLKTNETRNPRSTI